MKNSTYSLAKLIGWRRLLIALAMAGAGVGYVQAVAPTTSFIDIDSLFQSLSGYH